MCVLLENFIMVLGMCVVEVDTLSGSLLPYVMTMLQMFTYLIPCLLNFLKGVQYVVVSVFILGVDILMTWD